MVSAQIHVDANGQLAFDAEDDFDSPSTGYSLAVGYEVVDNVIAGLSFGGFSNTLEDELFSSLAVDFSTISIFGKYMIGDAAEGFSPAVGLGVGRLSVEVFGIEETSMMVSPELGASYPIMDNLRASAKYQPYLLFGDREIYPDTELIHAVQVGLSYAIE